MVKDELEWFADLCNRASCDKKLSKETREKMSYLSKECFNFGRFISTEEESLAYNYENKKECE